MTPLVLGVSFGERVAHPHALGELLLGVESLAVVVAKVLRGQLHFGGNFVLPPLPNRTVTGVACVPGSCLSHSSLLTNQTLA